MARDTDCHPAPTVAAVVLTLDESTNVERCVGSLMWCDDIVVLDSGSSDDTKQMARKLGARVYEHRPPIPFQISDQRNWALTNCHLSADWVLFLDADEQVPTALAREIRARIRSTSADGFQIANKYIFYGRWMKRSQRYPQWHDRLVRTGPTRYEGGVWEHFPRSTGIERLDEPYLHFGNSKGFRDWLQRHDRYAAWEATIAETYLDSHDRSAFRTERRLAARAAAARLWPFRPFVRFFYTYIVRLGFTEGLPGLLLALRYSMYEYMIVENILEQRRRRSHTPL
jgi:glycosyltransferase involved in cell wall biosynthesis